MTKYSTSPTLAEEFDEVERSYVKELIHQILNLQGKNTGLLNQIEECRKTIRTNNDKIVAIQWALCELGASIADEGPEVIIRGGAK